MNEMHDSFVFYRSFAEQFKQVAEDVNCETAWKCINALMDYALDGIEPPRDVQLYGFRQMKASIDAAQGRYTKAKQDGKQGGAPKKELAIEDILTLQSEGCTQKQIAKELNISVSTVKRRLEEYKQRLAVQDRNEPIYTVDFDLNSSSYDTAKELINSSEVQNPSSKVQNQVQNFSSKAQFSSKPSSAQLSSVQNLNINTNINTNMNTNTNKNANKNMNILNAARENELLMGQNLIAKKSSALAQNHTTSFEPMEVQKYNREESSQIAQNSYGSFGPKEIQNKNDEKGPQIAQNLYRGFRNKNESISTGEINEIQKNSVISQKHNGEPNDSLRKTSKSTKKFRVIPLQPLCYVLRARRRCVAQADSFP